MNNTLLIALLTPILMAFTGIITWYIKTRKEEILNIELRSREFKIKTYKALLEPYVALWITSLSQEQKQNEIKKVLTIEYKNTIFDLMTFGSDEVINIFNKIMQTAYHQESYKKKGMNMQDEYSIRFLSLFSELLLRIRKDLYSKKTKLQRSEMIENMITDIENYKEQINRDDF
jgi:hypothetical protein